MTQGQSKDDRRRAAVEHMVKVNKETAVRMGNEGRVTETEIRRYVADIARKADREMDGK